MAIPTPSSLPFSVTLPKVENGLEELRLEEDDGERRSPATASMLFGGGHMTFLVRVSHQCHFSHNEVDPLTTSILLRCRLPCSRVERDGGKEREREEKGGENCEHL
ncbi:Hypothetical predicted protein [Olea europaea subsp. europaea]|uniref:Uncharacterized protein n=1 Tax=Olea europaea subsp. europaea TaxID=158383 RepID=A0A8S0UU77_OLEEU|nr:Hypothetical predicted protein [Olea europaea subsp. europaea]